MTKHRIGIDLGGTKIEGVILAPDGRELTSLKTFTPGAMVQTIPLSDTITPAMAIGRQLEWLAGGFGLAGLALGILLRRRRPAKKLRPSRSTAP